jgi:hypothetical protein
MWNIRRPKTNWFNKGIGIFNGVMFTLLGCFHVFVIGKKYSIILIVIGIALVLVSLFSKVDGNMNSSDVKH